MQPKDIGRQQAIVRQRRNPTKGLPASVQLDIVKADVSWLSAAEAHPKLAPYLNRALDWRNAMLKALGVQYDFVGAFVVALISNGAVAYALACHALAEGRDTAARGHLGETRSSLLAAWTIANRDGSAKTVNPQKAIDALMAEWSVESGISSEPPPGTEDASKQ